jgi:hypothetical protein
MAKVKTTRFRNTSAGYVGVSKYKPNGDEDAIAVEPHGTVELTDEEIELTARAPRDQKDNPFTPQPFLIRDPNTDEILEEGVRPLLVVDDSEVFLPNATGSRPEGEEVGTPAATRVRRRAKAEA